VPDGPDGRQSAASHAHRDQPRRVLVVSAGMGAGHHAAADEALRPLRQRGHVAERIDVLDLGRPGQGRRLRRTYALLLRRLPWVYDGAMRFWARWPWPLERFTAFGAAAARAPDGAVGRRPDPLEFRAIERAPRAHPGDDRVLAFRESVRTGTAPVDACGSPGLLLTGSGFPSAWATEGSSPSRLFVRRTQASGPHRFGPRSPFTGPSGTSGRAV
jgi:hypothetical protein